MFLLVFFVLIFTSTQDLTTASCLRYNSDIQNALLSDVPPLASMTEDNLFNISRAVYPSIDLPAQYIKVSVHFLYSNRTAIDYDKSMKFTWSEACLYVATDWTSLTAMTWYSLGTILPRSKTELHVTLSPFCENFTTQAKIKEKMKYFISTLQDLAVIASSSDPRLNTAHCVVHGQDGDQQQPINPLQDIKLEIYRHFTWIALVASLLSCGCVYYLFYDWAENNLESNVMCPLRSISCLFLLYNIAYVIVVLVHYKFTAVQVVQIAIPLPVTVVFVFVGLFIKIGCCSGSKWHFVLAPALFLIIHHFIWMTIGISTAPFWAVPLFLFICVALLLIAFGLYQWRNVISEETLKKNNKLVCFIFVLFFIIVILYLCIVILSSLGQVYGLFNNGLAAQSILSAVLLWLFHHFYQPKPKEVGEAASLSNAPAPPNNETQSPEQIELISESSQS